MSRIVIFGNSGAGKSTLAKDIALQDDLEHFDLDTVAWAPLSQQSPPKRQPLKESKRRIDAFAQNNKRWVIEGCYSDLLELVLPIASEIIYLNLPIQMCVSNAKKRPWEPHKYESKEAQDANLSMLIDWITEYTTRDDTFSASAHQALFDLFNGPKTVLLSNDDTYDKKNPTTT